MESGAGASGSRATCFKVDSYLFFWGGGFVTMAVN